MSDKAYKKKKSRSKIIQCKTCGKDMKVFLSRLLRGRGKYCSSKCFHIYLSKKIRTGKIIKCDYCEKLIYRSPWYLKNHKNNFCSRSCKARYRADKLRGKLIPELSGKNHWNWKGGITDERTRVWHSKEYQEWRKEVYEKDNYTCQKCGDSSGNNLIPHHIESFADFPKLRFEINNGITLCENCHTYFNSKY